MLILNNVKEISLQNDFFLYTCKTSAHCLLIVSHQKKTTANVVVKYIRIKFYFLHEN